MAQPRQSQPAVLELVPTPHDAPPPYEEVSPPSPTYRYYSGERHRCENCAGPSSYRAPSCPAPQQPANPVEKLYNQVNLCNGYKWVSGMVCLGASAVVLSKFPASSLRPFLIYLISISVLHFFCPALSVRPFSTTTPRPPLWHFFTVAASTAMWASGAVALLTVYSRDREAAVPRGDSPEERDGADRWENAVVVAAVAGLFALISCLWQSFNTLRLCGEFSESDIREGYKRIWETKERRRERRAARRVRRAQQRVSV